jgi:class 3 adenylate cyclase
VPTVPRRTKLPFWLKLTLLSGAAVVLPMAVVGPRVISESVFGLETVSRDLRVAVARDVAGTIDGTLSGAEDGLDAVGRILTDPTLDPDVSVRLASLTVSANATIDHAAVYDAEGRSIDTIRERAAADVELPETLDEELRAIAAREGSATGAVDGASREARVWIVVPLRVEDRTTGYVASRVPLATVSERVRELADGHFRDLPDAIYVVDSEQRIVVHPEPARGELRSMRGRGIFAELGRAPGAAELSTEYVHEGTPMVGSIVPIPRRGWAVVAQVPEDVAYGPVHQIRTALFVTVGVAVALALFVAVLLSLRITRPIRQLTQFADDLASRRFDRRVTVVTSDELAILGDAMSAAAANLEESEERIKEEVAIRSDLGRYLPAELVDKVVKREQDMGLGGVRREITVLFADVVAFTPLTDRLAAEEVVGILNELFTILTEVVFRHGGTVDKFVGDCVMAVWGAPEAHPDHAARALAAAEEMQQWLEAGNAGWRERFDVTIELAIGVHTGEAVVGNIGSDTRMEYTAIGDVVNVAARLEAIARPRQILVSRETREAAGDRFEYVDRGERELAGRARPVHLFEVQA